MTNVVQFSGSNPGEDTKRVAQARARVDEAREHLDKWVELTKLIFLEGDYLVLGYTTFQDFCREEYRTILQLAGDERTSVFEEFKAIGMSNREIAAATGVHERTVRRSTSAADAADDDLDEDQEPDGEAPVDIGPDLPVSGSESAVDEWDEDAGQDDTGEAYAEPDEPDEDADEIVDAEIVDEPDQGKAQAPAALLIDRTDKIIGSIDRLTDQLEKLAADKRWSGERRKILARMKVSLGQLQSALDVVHAK